MYLRPVLRHEIVPTRWIIAALTILLTMAAQAAPSAPDNACLKAELSAEPAFSGVVLVRQKGRTQIAAQGAADPSGSKLQENSRLNLGSANKMFTAVAVAQLVEKGKLSLDAPIGTYVGGLTEPVAAVTLRQLLTHSGGLGNYVTPDNLPALLRAKSLSEQMALVKEETPRFTPGSKFGYSNTGFLLAGLAVERASGQTFAAYLKQNIFKPAGMTMTSLDPSLPTPAVTGMTRLPEFMPSMGPGPGPAPAPGSKDAGPTSPQAPPPIGPLRPAAESALPGSPAGSAYSTVGDLARFFDALKAGKLVSASMVQQLTTARIDAAPPGAPQDLKYGLGFGVVTWNGRRSYGHNGGAPGVNVEVIHYPDDDVVIVVLANRDPPVAAQRLIKLRKAVFDGNFCR
jgi:D-alanyl-D-alanine carboxypeptidase